ncbi:KICSTOR complex protein kaptin-like isoform X1 [Diorhabda sublineata]|uniref:KICSTOR complex protein kaptin-like isoform X1 n=2 Tax=Diorhabda sublineata TaxID=1163346 RepID=UPI0024E0894A|nr:KICSTOR complex protein kaptin-like isoform X1 [Diorhabda sublineata]
MILGQFKDVHFFHTASQGNIYTLVELPIPNGTTKILVASLKREVYCFEFQESSSGSLIPSSKEVLFTYIPNGAEIISMDAFNKSTNSIEIVIGITIIKNSNDTESRLDTYLNIYSGEDSDELNIENIAQSCLSVELGYIPYKLLHTYLVIWNEDELVSKEVVFIISGNDNQVHAYKESSDDHNYKEIEIHEYFPEFTKTPSPVIWIDIYYHKNFSERVTAFGCECGYVKMFKVDVKNKVLEYNFCTRFGNYISKVCIVPDKNSPKNCDIINKIRRTEGDKEEEVKLNLIVVNTILPPVIFHDILKYGLSNYSTLPKMESIGIMTCCEVNDIDFDGEKEIIMGTNTQEIILYKKDSNNTWWLEELKLVTAPVLGIKYVDMTGDGVRDLAILSMNGVQVLQHDHNFLQKVLNEKIEILTLPDISGLKVD